MTEQAFNLLHLPVEQFLNRLADRAPTPGGGAAASLVGALACATARMVGAYSIDRRTPPEQSERISTLCAELERADRMLRELVAEDAAAYDELARTRRAVRDGNADPGAWDRALAVALAVPLEIAATASAVLRVLAELRPAASNSMLSDLGVAAVLADACVRAAGYTVRVNAAELPDERQRCDVLDQLDELVSNASQTRRTIESALPQPIRPLSPPS